MGELQASMGVVSQPAAHPSQSIVDVSENMRAKIYALFSKMGKWSSAYTLQPSQQKLQV
jgi:hypothetical protein